MNRINQKIYDAQEMIDFAMMPLNPDRELYKRGVRQWEDFAKISQAIRGWHEVRE